MRDTEATALSRGADGLKSAGELINGSDRRFRALFENANDCILLISEGRVIDCNPKTEESMGYSREELLGRMAWEFSPERQLDDRDSKKRAIEKMQAALSGVPQFFEWTAIKSDGSRIHAEVNLSGLEIGGKPMLQAIVRDVTGRKRREEALRESEERYRNVYNTAPLAFVIWDRDCNVTGWNKRAEQIFGWSGDEVLGRNFFDFLVAEEDRPRIQDVVKTLLNGVLKPNIINKNLTKAGETIICRWNNSILSDHAGNIIGAISLGLDITEQKKAEAALRESEERFRALTEKVSDIAMIIGKDGRISYASPSVRVLGQKPVDIAGEMLEDLIHPDDRASVRKSIGLSTERQGKTVRMSDFRMRRKDGSWPVLEGFLTCLFDQPGVNGIVLNGRDITEKRRLQELASRAQRLETAGRVAGQVAHDFNNLLGPLVAYPDIIRDELPEDHPVQEYIRDMKNAADQMSEINQQLLTLGRRGHYNQEPLNLNEIVNQALSRIRPTPESLIIDKQLENDLMNIMGGRAQILRAVANLVANARDAMQDAGKLTIRTENLYIDVASGKFTNIQKGEYVKLTVSDTGTGIETDILPRIFDPFFTTKTSTLKHGSGLGLSVVNAVVEDHAGCIDYESVQGAGTSFYLYFPTTREVTTPQEETRIVGGTEKVLIVDDDRVQREVNTRLLEKLGYKTSAVRGGEEALEFLRKCPQDILIIDMIMPDGIDGAETFRRVLGLNPSQKAIMVSGYADVGSVREALELGSVQFLRKPLSLKTIARAVRTALDHEPKRHSEAAG